jgi:hypothetical protein
MKPIIGLGIVLSFVLAACDASTSSTFAGGDRGAQAASAYRAQSTQLHMTSALSASPRAITSTRAPHASTTAASLSPHR